MQQQRRVKEKVKCSFCKKLFSPLYISFLNYKKKKQKHIYCSTECCSKSKIGKPRPDMVKKMKNNKYRINKKPGNSFYKVNETFFKKINSEISAYWFGLLLADGNMLYDSKKGYSIIYYRSGKIIEREMFAAIT